MQTPPNAPPCIQARSVASSRRSILARAGQGLGLLLASGGGALTILILLALGDALRPPDDVDNAFRCGMPVAAVLFGLMITIPATIMGGALMAGCRPTRTQRGR
jgi:hypothetical protein